MGTISSVSFGLVTALLMLVATGCGSSSPSRTGITITPVMVSSIERLDPALDKLIWYFAEVEELDRGFTWAEGPVWLKDEKVLLFSDVPKNVVYRWKKREGRKVYLQPSGYTGPIPRTGGMLPAGRDEPGSNGLTLDPQGRLVLCQHGDRRVARLEKDGKTVTPIAERYEGKRFNSPNDCVYDSKGNLYFTDPPYGLMGKADDPTKELPFQGVYRVTPDGKITLLTKEMTRPNGLAFSPDEKTLYVANSDPDNPIWMAFPINIYEGTLGQGKVLFDATHLVKDFRAGLPDGLKVDKDGILFATGPGGVLVLTPQGKHLGTIETGQGAANCAWGDDGKTLYITAHMFLCRIKLKTSGRLLP